MKKKVQIFTLVIFFIVNLLLDFGTYFGIQLSDFARVYLHLASALCFAISIYLDTHIKKNMKIILFVILAVYAALPFATMMGF